MKKIGYVLGIAVLSLSLASCKGVGSGNVEEVEKPTYKVVEKVIEIEKPIYVEKEVIVEVEKPKYVEKEKTVEVEVEKTVYIPKEVEKVIEVEKPIYVEKEKIVEVEKPKYVEVETEYPTYIKTEYVEVEKIVEKPIYVEKQIVNLETLENVEVEKLGTNLYRYVLSVSNWNENEVKKLFKISGTIQRPNGVNGFCNGELEAKSGIVIKDIKVVSKHNMILPLIYKEENLFSEEEQTILKGRLVSKTYSNILEEGIKIAFDNWITGTTDEDYCYGPEEIYFTFSLRETTNNEPIVSGTYNDNEGWGEIHS